MTKVNVVYGVGKRTSASSTAARHIDDGTGKPLCQHKTKTGHGFGSGYVQDFDEPTCKRCLKLAAPAETPPSISDDIIPAFEVMATFVRHTELQSAPEIAITPEPVAIGDNKPAPLPERDSAGQTYAEAMTARMLALEAQLADARKDASEWKRIAGGVVADYEKLFAECKSAVARVEKAEADCAAGRQTLVGIAKWYMDAAPPLCPICNRPHGESHDEDCLLLDALYVYENGDGLGIRLLARLATLEADAAAMRRALEAALNFVNYIAGDFPTAIEAAAEISETLVKALHPDAD